MRDRTKYRAIVIFFTLLVTFSLAFTSFAKSVKTKTTKQVTGYCVYHGRIFNTTESTCKKHHGTFFKDKAKAEAYLDAQTPGYCCLDNKVFELKKGDCLKKRGHFFEKKAGAISYCESHQPGWCCIDGKVISMKKGVCEKKRGHFFKEKRKASDYPDLHQKGYCCLDGKVTETLKDSCLKRKGYFFRKKEAAAQYCESRQKGYCLLEGKILSMTKGDCLKRKGRFYKGKNDARKAYEASKQGWCCRNGRIRRLTKGACEKNKGKYFAQKQETSKYLQSLKERNKSLTRTQMAKACSGKKTKTIPKPNSHFINTGNSEDSSKSSEMRVNAPPLPRKKHLTFSSNGPVLTSSGGDSVSTSPGGEQPKTVRGQGPKPMTPINRTRARSLAKHFPAKIIGIVKSDEVTSYYDDYYSDNDYDTGFYPSRCHPGDIIAILGKDFGRNQGRVDILTSGISFPCEITRWSESEVDCRIPSSLKDAIINQHNRNVIVWLKPARVEPPEPPETPDPGTMHLPGPRSSDEEPYYYSGDEGPVKHFTIYPLVARIDRLSQNHISPLEEVTIHGRNFGDSRGKVYFRVHDERGLYNVRVMIWRWNNTEIRIHLSDTAANPAENATDRLHTGENQPAEISVTNRAGYSCSAPITFVPGGGS